jgi:hypothetical protein
MMPIRMEKRPSCFIVRGMDFNGEEGRTRMKIQAQPGLPPIPFMFWIAAAKRPEKAPESYGGEGGLGADRLAEIKRRTDAAEKNNAILTTGALSG